MTAYHTGIETQSTISSTQVSEERSWSQLSQPVLDGGDDGDGAERRLRRPHRVRRRGGNPAGAAHRG